MAIDDVDISQLIVENYFSALKERLRSDVCLVGAGPANLVAATLLAQAGRKVTLFEKKLAPGGGMWGGGMMFSRIVVQPEAKHLLDEFGIGYTRDSRTSLLVADSVEAAAALTFHACRAGVAIFNLISAEDVLIENERVTGLVINWTPVGLNKLHVDPIMVRAAAVVDGTGHDALLCELVARRGLKLATATGGVVGEGAMAAETGERLVVERTGEIFPGLWLLGMAAAAVHGSPRMGPIFGGMMLSGEKLANLLKEI